MIPLTVSTPLSSFLEAYDLAKKTLREAGYVDTNFTIQTTNGRMVDLKTVQSGGDFLIEPGSAMLSNPPQPYAFAKFKNERPDPRGNYFPLLSPKHLSASLVHDMFEQHGAFQGTCNIISGLNMKVRSPSLPHQGIMRARIVDVDSITPGSEYVRSNPRPIVARPAQILAGQEDIFNAEIDRRLKEYFSEEGYRIDPYTEVSTSPDGQPMVSYHMSDVDQFYDNHRMSSKYQVNTDVLYRFCNYVLEPYLVHSATVDNFIRHMNAEILPSLTRLGEEGRNVGLDSTPVGGNSRSARAGNRRRYSSQMKYMMQRLATDAADFYHGKDMSLMVHPIFLIPHMQFVLLPPPHIELEGARNRRTHVTRAERVLNEGGEPPRYANTGQRIIVRYSEREGSGGPALVPLHHTAAVGPGTAAFSWAFLQERIQNLDVPGILEALFAPLEQDEVEITAHRVQDYVEAARRLYNRTRNAEDTLSQNNLNKALRRNRTPWRGTRQTGEMVSMPYIGNYTRAELNRMKKDELIDLAMNMTGVEGGYGTKAETVQAILDYQANNPNLYEVNYHTVVMANTPILFEIDLPGLHPNPVGWPEELVYSMMEVLAKYREQIAGLNGTTFSREDFLSPSINSDFRFDPDAEVEVSWYDEDEQRQRRYGLSYRMIRDALRYSTEEDNLKYYHDKLSVVARTAYSLMTLSDSMMQLDATQRRNFDDLSEMLGIINSQPKGKLTTGFARYNTLYNQLLNNRVLETMGYITAAGATKHLFDAGGDNIVNARNRMEFCQLIIQMHWDDFFQYAMQSGQGMVNLNVDTSNGLSSMFILREILKQSRTKYNYVASADDTAFIYHVLVWCLDNCLGARRQTSEERRGITDLLRGVMNNLADRRERNVADVVGNAFDNANLDEVQEALLIDEMLRRL